MDRHRPTRVSHQANTFLPPEGFLVIEAALLSEAPLTLLAPVALLLLAIFSLLAGASEPLSQATSGGGGFVVGP